MNKDDEKFYGIAKWFIYLVYVAAFTSWRLGSLQSLWRMWRS